MKLLVPIQRPRPQFAFLHGQADQPTKRADGRERYRAIGFCVTTTTVTMDKAEMVARPLRVVFIEGLKKLTPFQHRRRTPR